MQLLFNIHLKLFLHKNNLVEDHNFTKHNVVPYITLIINITGTAGKSIFSGGVEGSGKVSVSLHDKTLNSSDGLKHASDLINIMKDEARPHFTDDDRDTIQPTAYLLHMEFDGGGDYEFRRV